MTAAGCIPHTDAMETLETGLERPLILHVSGDFPDPFEPFKTRVIETLLALTDIPLRHRVISINRVSPGRTAAFRQLFRPGDLTVQTQGLERGLALTYEAPSLGLRHRTRLLQLGDWLTEAIRAMPKRPDLIVGHKLTIEGIAVRRAAEALRIPYALALQGGTDQKIMAFRPDLHEEFRRVLHGAEVIFPFAPWTWDYVVDALGVPPGKSISLPCPTDLDQPIAPRQGGDGLLSVFHLKSYKRKNLAGLARSAQALEDRGISVPICVVGGGEGEDLAACEALTKDRSSMTLAGAMNREQLRDRMLTASGFVLPSLRESFGLVFIEALFAGLPIIYPQGTAVDGYFDNAPFALGVNARDPAALADAMCQLMENEATMKTALADWQTSNAAKRFQRGSIASEFAQGLMLASGFRGGR
ncbi:MAG: glycosyltransferase [Pseudomonadota bacterium]